MDTYLITGWAITIISSILLILILRFWLKFHFLCFICWGLFITYGATDNLFYLWLSGMCVALRIWIGEITGE